MRAGFYTTPDVRAPDRSSAEANAIALVRAELATTAQNPSTDPTNVVIEEVTFGGSW